MNEKYSSQKSGIVNSEEASIKRPASQCALAVGCLNESVDCFEKTLALLHERMDPVLLRRAVEEKSKSEPPEETLAPLPTKIRLATKRILELNNLVLKIVDQIEA